jgi:hypothetical protein
MNPLPSAPEILALAREQTGVSIELDRHFTAALTALVDSINRESSLTDDGRTAALNRWLRVCSNRLRVDADLAANPDIDRVRLQPPVIINGLPRVGSTKLHQLLARTADFQTLLFWQGFNPARQSADPERDRQLRIDSAVQFLDWRTRRNPLANAAHYMAAQEPEEDTYLLEYSLHTYWPVTYFKVDSFLAWLRQQDRDHAFEYLSRLLKYLQWQFHGDTVRPWLLKSPPNLGYEAEMTRHLHGARFIMLHRDPVETMPSLVAIMRELRKLYGPGASDLKVAGAWAMDEYPRAMRRYLDWRRQQPEGVVLDIAYRDVRDNYESAVASIYRFCGLELTTRAKANMANWAGDNEQHKHGLHQYSLDEAGLSPTAIRAAFGDYISNYERYL